MSLPCWVSYRERSKRVLMTFKTNSSRYKQKDQREALEKLTQLTLPNSSIAERRNSPSKKIVDFKSANMTWALERPSIKNNYRVAISSGSPLSQPRLTNTAVHAGVCRNFISKSALPEKWQRNMESKDILTLQLSSCQSIQLNGLALLFTNRSSLINGAWFRIS